MGTEISEYFNTKEYAYSANTASRKVNLDLLHLTSKSEPRLTIDQRTS